MKAIWTGTISFGLVSIPVKLYAAVSEHVLGFTLLCSKCHSPIKYKRFCSGCHKEVAWQDVVKGIKIAPGKYFIATQEAIARLKPTSTDVIAIKEFVHMVDINPIYFERHYYIGPKKTNERAFFLFKKALMVTDKAAIGTFVMREKEYVCAISPHEDGLLLSTLNYAYEIRSMDGIPYLDEKIIVTTAELGMAKKLVNELSAKTFSIKQYKDTFAQRLKKALSSSAFKRITTKEAREAKVSRTKVEKPSLLTALQESVASTKKRRKKTT